MDNPFVMKAYASKELFCDRQNEVNQLIINVKGGVNTTLIADRRIGKTGLIYRLFDEIKDQKLSILTIYIDIFATKNLSDFIKFITEAMLDFFPEKTPIGKKFLNFIKGFRPVMSFDPITGSPQFELTYRNEEEKNSTLFAIMDFLEKQNKPVLLAIDEFQQIREYPETNLEALLRSKIQFMQNVTFIFCGSKKHLMMDIFSNHSKPFYCSTAFLWLDKISEEEYAPFIKQLFAKGKKTIDDSAIEFILSWTRRHTYYTQALCHKVFDESKKKVTMVEVKSACASLLEMNAPYYLQYRTLLTDSQWNLLIAIAKEGAVEQLYSSIFLQKYQLGSPSTVKRMVDSLVEKDLLTRTVSIQATTISVSDVFLARWIESVY